MYPKTQPPFGLLPLEEAVNRRGPLPLWEAADAARRLLSSLIDRPASFPQDPGELLFGPEGLYLKRTAAADSPGLYGAPEERLAGRAVPAETAAVYRFFLLFYHLAAGKPLSAAEAERLADRRLALKDLSRILSENPEERKLLFRLFDQGLRLEPSRRFPTLRALLSALDKAEEELCGSRKGSLILRGTAGVYAGQELPLSFPAVLGRRPDCCQILFPPDTPGVSRLHARLDLSWGTVTVRDLGSSYGTFLDGNRLPPQLPASWKPGDVLSLGSLNQSLTLLLKEAPLPRASQT